MIKKILGIFIALSIVICAIFSPQYITTIVALPFIYLTLKLFSHKNFIEKYFLFLSLIIFVLVFTLNYIVINHTNLVIRHDIESFTITSNEACIQQINDVSIVILCKDKPFFDFENATYTPLSKGNTFKILSVDSDSENFNHSVIVKMKDPKENIFFIKVKNSDIGEFKINGISHPITNDFLINLSYIAAIPIAFVFIAIFAYLFFF